MAADMVEQVGDVAAIVDDLLALYGGRELQMVSSELTLGAVGDSIHEKKKED